MTSASFSSLATDNRLSSSRFLSTVDASVVDIFCGVGGLSHGMKLEDFSIACGIDLDEDCRYAYEKNNEAPFIRMDVSRLSGRFLNENFHPGSYRILAGCAPCQPFSVYNQKNDDPQWRLLSDFGRLVEESNPHVVTMENVPRLSKFRNGEVFGSFIRTLEKCGYHIWWKPVFCPEYGVPQTRTRLVLLASRLGPIELEAPTHTPDRFVRVGDVISKLSFLQAGEMDPSDPFHCASRMSPMNLKRIRESKPGGSWREWPEELVTDCHRRETGRGYTSVYGRMSWDEPSPTITTQFYGFGNGRFGHPDQDRALSLREGAILQTFPEDYAFVEPGRTIHFKKVGKMIGNAVPVLLGRAIARSIRRHLEEAALGRTE